MMMHLGEAGTGTAQARPADSLLRQLCLRICMQQKFWMWSNKPGSAKVHRPLLSLVYLMGRCSVAGPHAMHRPFVRLAAQLITTNKRTKATSVGGLTRKAAARHIYQPYLTRPCITSLIAKPHPSTLYLPQAMSYISPFAPLGAYSQLDMIPEVNSSVRDAPASQFLDATLFESVPVLRPPPKAAPTAADWERHRPLIRRLYVNERLKLNEVAKIMAAEHGHVAT